MKRIVKHISYASLLILFLIILFSGNICAQEKRHEHRHDNGRHEGLYKKEERSVHKDKAIGVERDSKVVYRRVRYNDRDYFFRGGRFYEFRNQAYFAVTPPIGIRITYLPSGYKVVYHKRLRYYFFGGIYYRFSPAVRMYVVVNSPF